MMQKTLAMETDAGAGLERYRKPTPRDECLQTMEARAVMGVVLDDRAALPQGSQGKMKA